MSSFEETFPSSDISAKCDDASLAGGARLRTGVAPRLDCDVLLRMLHENLSKPDLSGG
jgi:hypothetical protein